MPASLPHRGLIGLSRLSVRRVRLIPTAKLVNRPADLGEFTALQGDGCDLCRKEASLCGHYDGLDGLLDTEEAFDFA